MKKSKILVLNIIILVCFLSLYNLIEWILNIYNLAFRHTVFYPYIAIMGVLSFLLILQIIRFFYCVAKEKKFKLLLRIISGIGTTVVSLLLAITLFFTPFTFAFWHQPEHVVEKDGKNMVAYVDSFMQITVYYYEYKNPLIRGKQLKIMVDGGSGGSDPYENGGEGPHIYRYEYYDDDGNTLDTNWAG